MAFFAIGVGSFSALRFLLGFSDSDSLSLELESDEFFEDGESDESGDFFDDESDSSDESDDFFDDESDSPDESDSSITSY